MVPKYVIDLSIIWLNDNIYSRNTWFPTTDVQTQNIGKLRYANRRAPTECRHTVATQATEYQRWHDVGCRSRRCRPMPTLGQRRSASWVVAWTAPSHYLNQCWNIVNWTLGNKLQWNFSRNSNIFIEENTFENVVCEMLFISSRPQCVKLACALMAIQLVPDISPETNKLKCLNKYLMVALIE